MLICPKCLIKKQESDFHKNKRKPNGLSYQCKDCYLAYQKKYVELNRQRINVNNKEYYSINQKKIRAHRSTKAYKAMTHKSYQEYYKKNRGRIIAKSSTRAASIKQRTPKWSDPEAINAFYRDCPKGMVVDHIVPLNGKTVSGLHILSNLQYLSAKDNLIKGNKFPYTKYSS